MVLSRNRFHVYWTEDNKSKAVPYQQAHMCTTDLHDEIETNIPRDCSSIRNVLNNVKPCWPEGRKFPEEKKNNWETICQQVIQLQDTRQVQDSRCTYGWDAEQSVSIEYVLYNLHTVYKDLSRELHKMWLKNDIFGVYISTFDKMSVGLQFNKRSLQLHIRLTSIPTDKHNFSVYYSSVKAFRGALVLKKYSCKNLCSEFCRLCIQFNNWCPESNFSSRM